MPEQTSIPNENKYTLEVYETMHAYQMGELWLSEVFITMEALKLRETEIKKEHPQAVTAVS